MPRKPVDYVEQELRRIKAKERSDRARHDASKRSYLKRCRKYYRTDFSITPATPDGSRIIPR